MFRLEFEPDTSRIQVRTVTSLAASFLGMKLEKYDSHM
jgi:hypothetical protein